MEKWKHVSLCKEEEEGITMASEEVCDGEIFQRTLAGKLWTDNHFNSRAFMSTAINAWKLKNPVELQELSKNVFLFRFTTKRDLENVLRNGPRSFDRNLLVSERISGGGGGQPSYLNMHYGVFWVRIYELPLMLHSEAMAKKLGGILRKFEEVDHKEVHRNRRFLRIKVTMDLKKLLKGGIIVHFKEKNLRVHFKYKRLLSLCFVCGRIGHQLKDCEGLGKIGEESFEDIDEQELSFGLWLRASPLPKVTEEQKKRESSSGNCSNNLFNNSSSYKKCDNRREGKDGEEVEVEQQAGNTFSEEVNVEASPTKQPGDCLVIEVVAESLGAIDISNMRNEKTSTIKGKTTKRKKWTRQKRTMKGYDNCTKNLEVETGKRQLVEVMVTEGEIEECESIDKKRKNLI
ncbi:unnamed protein product [Lathyrus sativus]|nr:unnamed protein product [Lathyrus sativus]